jgi:hypothetical protein
MFPVYKIWNNCIYAYYTILYFVLCTVFINLNIQIVPHAVLFACIGWLYYSFDNRELYLDIILDNRVSVMPKRSVFRLPKWSRTCILRRPKSQLHELCDRLRNRWLEFHATFRTDIFAQASWIVWHCWAFFHMAHISDEKSRFQSCRNSPTKIISTLRRIVSDCLRYRFLLCFRSATELQSLYMAITRNIGRRFFFVEFLWRLSPCKAIDSIEWIDFRNLSLIPCSKL